MSDKIPPTCATFGQDIQVLEAKHQALQQQLAAAKSAAEKALITSEIKDVLKQLATKQTALHACVQTAELLDVCPTKPDSLYRLPFEYDTHWQLWNGNWDDPKAGHNMGNINGLQAFAFDFISVGPDGNGAVGQKILAARPGKVVVTVSSESANSYHTNDVFFFKGSQYLKYDVGKDAVYPGYPQTLDAKHWPGWPSNWNSVDAAVNWGNGTAFFFRGAEYLKYDIAHDQVVTGYPKPLDAAHWPGWPAAWNSGVDAALFWGNGKVYFFKGGEYLRYDIVADHVDGTYPRLLNSQSWNGWPKGWESGVDVAVNWSHGRAYFFKKNQYLRYIMSPYPDHVDANQLPQTLDAAHWPGWPSGWTTGADAAVVWQSGYLGVGNYLIIQHSDGTYGVYWHIEQNGIRVKVGDTVGRGDWIASTGTTGNSSTPHLHFDVRTGWDYGYPADGNEFKSVPVRFQSVDQNCWIPRVGQPMLSNNTE